ncbi:hypothetical protein CsSME_00046605 [Camellia sinensis var. sinensis]
MDPSGGVAARFRIQRTTSSSSTKTSKIFFMDPSSGAAARFRIQRTTSSSSTKTTFSGPATSPTTTVPPPRIPFTPLPHSHHHHGVGRAENFGILAALPSVSESDQTRSVFNHKASTSVSSSTSSTWSSSRMILKKPPLDQNSLFSNKQE